MSGTFRERAAARANERERAQAEREYNERRSGGIEERARQREAEAAQRRDRVRAEQAARREAQVRARAQADVERFNRPPRIVPYEERLPTATPRETQAGGGGGGRLPPPNAPTALPAPEGRAGLPAPRGGLPATTPGQIPLTTPRMPLGAGAGLAATAGPALQQMTSDYLSRRIGEAEAANPAALRRAAAAADRLQQDPEGTDVAAAAREMPRENDNTLPTRPRPPARNQSGGGSRARGTSEADRLNEISWALSQGERPRGAEATNIARRMGIEGYKKGGLIGAKKAAPKKMVKPVKKAAGGSIKAAAGPKVPGRAPGRPATAVKPMGTKPLAKAMAGRKPTPMPAFKKGGKVAAKKGRR